MIEGVATTSKEPDLCSGPLQPKGDHTPSHPVTLEPEKADRAGCPLTSEFYSALLCSVFAFSLVSCFRFLSLSSLK